MSKKPVTKKRTTNSEVGSLQMSKKPVTKKRTVSLEETDSPPLPKKPVTKKKSANVAEEATYRLPILFKEDKNGKERLWKIWVVDNVLYRQAGLVDGKKIIAKRTFEGKNVGRSNETTAKEQAELEADRAWTHQLDKGYLPKCKEGKALYKKVNKTKTESGGHNINASVQIRGGKEKNVQRQYSLMADTVEKHIIPMKSQKWETVDDSDEPLPKVAKYFDFEQGVYVQWKLDGWRCAVRIQTGGEVVMTSNNGKQYPWFSSLRKKVGKFLAGKKYLDGLDCELYVHHLYDTDDREFDIDQKFPLIQGICSLANKKPHPLEDQICLYVFDLIDLSNKHDQDTRFKLLKRLFKDWDDIRIVLVRTDVVNYSEEISHLHDEYAQEGYEGVIIRSRTLKYKANYRALEMRKYKQFVDREYSIVDAAKDKGVDDEHFVWVCETDEGERFKARPKGTREMRTYWYQNYPQFIGLPLTVRFQKYDEKSPGVPRFPIAVGIREEGDISNPPDEEDDDNVEFL